MKELSEVEPEPELVEVEMEPEPEPVMRRLLIEEVSEPANLRVSVLTWPPPPMSACATEEDWQIMLALSLGPMSWSMLASELDSVRVLSVSEAVDKRILLSLSLTQTDFLFLPKFLVISP